MTRQITYQFHKQPCGKWMYYDVDGLFGDMVLTTEVLKEHILPHLTCRYVGACTSYERVTEVIIQGFGKTLLAMVLMVYDNSDVVSVSLSTRDGSVVKHSAEQFLLTLPYHEGTPWPYPEDDDTQDSSSE